MVQIAGAVGSALTYGVDAVVASNLGPSQELVPMLLNEVQRQQRDLAEVTAENDRLRSIPKKLLLEHERAELGSDNITLRSTLKQIQGRAEQMAAQMPRLADRWA
jgi:hypothetical protein